ARGRRRIPGRCGAAKTASAADYPPGAESAKTCAASPTASASRQAGRGWFKTAGARRTGADRQKYPCRNRESPWRRQSAADPAGTGAVEQAPRRILVLSTTAAGNQDYAQNKRASGVHTRSRNRPFPRSSGRETRPGTFFTG